MELSEARSKLLLNSRWAGLGRGETMGRNDKSEAQGAYMSPNIHDTEASTSLLRSGWRRGAGRGGPWRSASENKKTIWRERESTTRFKLT
jgi:hypothetical protein